MATPPVIATERLQYGVQASIGTLVPATRVVDVTQGSIVFKPDMRSIVVRNSGSFANAHRGYTGQLTNGIDYTSSATFDRLADVGSLFFNKVTSGTGSGGTRTWTFTPPDTSDGLARYSFEYGGTNFPTAYTIQDGVGQKLDISIKANETWQLKQSILGTVSATGSLTGSLSLPSTLQGDDVLWTQTTVAIDPQSNNYGTTQSAGDIVSVDFSYANGLDSRYTLDGTNAPNSVLLANGRTVSAKIVLQYDTQTFYTNAFASTPQHVQIKATGPNSRSAKLNINGYWDTVTFGDDKGVKVLEMTLKGLYEASGGSGLGSDVQLIVVNGVSTLAGIP